MTRQLSDLDKVILGGCLFVLLGLASYVIYSIFAFDSNIKASCNYNLTHNLAFNDLCFKRATSEELTTTYAVMIVILLIITVLFFKWEKRLREKVFKRGILTNSLESDDLLR